MLGKILHKYKSLKITMAQLLINTFLYFFIERRSMKLNRDLLDRRPEHNQFQDIRLHGVMHMEVNQNEPPFP